MTAPSAWIHWLEGTAASVALRESIWVYPLVESVHVLALTVFLGLTVVLDLRLLGVCLTGAPVSLLIRRLMPWTLAGFVVMVVSGALLFYAVPVRTYFNVFFRLKLAFLIVAGLNAAVFHAMATGSLARWDLEATPPLRARLAGAVSLALWAAIVVCGRMIAYNWFDDASLTR